MAFLKKSSNLFLGVQELKSFADFLDEQGFRKFIKENSVKFGLIKNPSQDFPFINGKIEAGTNSGTIKISNVQAIDEDGLYIVGQSKDNIAIQSSATQFYWIKIKHKYTAIEKGTVTIAADGTLTGSDTEFLEKLRGQPDFPTKIRFVDSNNNPQEYEVLSVLDNNNAVLQGFFNAEANLQYEVVGTFTPGVAIPTGDKFPFQYDSMEMEIVAGGTTEPFKVSGKEFYLARVRNNGGVMIIEDKRTELWETIGSFELKSLPSIENKFIGVEAVKFADQFSTKDKNIVQVAWGLRSSNWTASNALRQITISNGEGGVFKKDNIIDPFVNGDFNGWRLYFESGKYATITESAIDAGAIKVTLDRLIPENYNDQEQILIVPDVEEIVLEFRSADNKLVDSDFTYPINLPFARVQLVVSSLETYNYKVSYRYKNNNYYSRSSNFVASDYYAESSFDEFGVLKINPADWVIKTLDVDTETGESQIELTSQNDSFAKTIQRVDKGDKFGVRFRDFSNISPLINLTAGTDEFYQKIQYSSPFNMTVHQIISFSSTAKAGNEFFIYIKGPINDPTGSYNLEIRQDYQSAGSQGTLITTIIPNDLKKGNIVLFAVFNGANNTWSVERMDAAFDTTKIGEIKMYSGSTVGEFDSTGLGVSPKWVNYAICNGNNGTPNLNERSVVGYDPSVGAFNMGQIGGASEVTIGLENIPPHTHKIFAIEDAVGGQAFLSNGSLANRRNVGNQRDYELGPTPSNLEPTTGRTSTSGGGNPISIVPKYYALAFIMKIA